MKTEGKVYDLNRKQQLLKVSHLLQLIVPFKLKPEYLQGLTNSRGISIIRGYSEMHEFLLEASAYFQPGVSILVKLTEVIICRRLTENTKLNINITKIQKHNSDNNRKYEKQTLIL